MLKIYGPCVAKCEPKESKLVESCRSHSTISVKTMRMTTLTNLCMKEIVESQNDNVHLTKCEKISQRLHQL